MLETSRGLRPRYRNPGSGSSTTRRNERHGFPEDHFGFALDEGRHVAEPSATSGNLVSARYCAMCLSVWPGSRAICACGATLTWPKIARISEESLGDVRRVVDVASPAKPGLLTNIYRSVLRKRGVNLNERQVTAIYHSMTKKWPPKKRCRKLASAVPATADKFCGQSFHASAITRHEQHRHQRRLGFLHLPRRLRRTAPCSPRCCMCVSSLSPIKRSRQDLQRKRQAARSNVLAATQGAPSSGPATTNFWLALCP